MKSSAATKASAVVETTTDELADSMMDRWMEQFESSSVGATDGKLTPNHIPIFRGQSLLQYKLEKKGTSPKTWYWPIFQIGKFDMAANQNDPGEIERNRSRKFLQFLENFSGVYPPGGYGE